MGLKLFKSTDHDGHWAVGVASIVLADSEDRARELLDTALVSSGLKPSSVEPYTLVEVPPTEAAHILCDGDY